MDTLGPIEGKQISAGIEASRQGITSRPIISFRPATADPRIGCRHNESTVLAPQQHPGLPCHGWRHHY